MSPDEPQRQKPSWSEMMELLDQTPKDVWREYLENGYTLHQMIREEFSSNY